MKFALSYFLLLLFFVSNNGIANSSEHAECSADVSFRNLPKSTSQTVNLDENTKLTLNQFLSTYTHESARVATNVVCQQLEGGSYTGSKEEWAGVIKNALDGINAKGATDVKLALTTELGKVYKGSENNKEYDFRANFTGNKQVIKNLTVLDLPRNTVYTLSVSGAEQIEDEVVKEFTRLVNSFKLKGAQ